VPSKSHEPFPRLYAIADAAFGDPVQLSQSLFYGGARLVQVRNKKAGTREVLDQVEQILAIAPRDARVVVNDRVDIALLSGAAGVHLGQTDLHPEAAREILGSARIIGISTHNIEQALEANELPVDYIAVGPIFPTTSKANPDPVIGLDQLSRIVEAVHKPIIAIGGVALGNARDVLKTGVSAIAVIQNVLSASDIAGRVREWIDILDNRDGDDPV
jgi:thiamine-phosphate pyrophosphorylase